MKKILSRVVNLSAVAVILMGAAQAIVLNMVVPATASAFAGGDGSTSYPYRITNCAELHNIQNEPTANYAVMNDIFDCGAWNPIQGFSGNLDGRNHSIYNISINQPDTDNVGMFSYINESATVKNLILANQHITARSNVGGLAGQISDNAVISNVTTAATITGDSALGGLVGVTIGGNPLIQSSTSTSTITSSSGSRIGGLVGEHDFGTIEDSFANASILANGSSGGVGGLVGFAYSGTTTKSSYAKGTITGGSYVGGLIGMAFNPGGAQPAISYNFSVTSILGATNFGGLVGYLYGGVTTTDNFYDSAAAAGVTTCDYSYSPAGCTAVNVGGGDNDHFKNNTSVAPFNSGAWDFTNKWNQTSEYPYPKGQIPDTLADIPVSDPPSDLIVSSTTSTTINLAWTAPTPNAGGPASDYIVEYRESGNLSWETFNDGTSDATSATITGLTPNTGYDVRIGAVNGGGASTSYATTDTTTAEVASSITSCDELQAIKYAPGGDYSLANDIDCSDTQNWNDNGEGGYFGFHPIEDFTGSLDGQGHSISGLYINRPNDWTIGLIGYAHDGASISNLTLNGGYMVGYGDVGSVVGDMEGGTIDHVNSSASVYGNEEVGGIVGFLFGEFYDNSITNVTSSGQVAYFDSNTSAQYIGGIIGHAVLEVNSTLTITNVSSGSDVIAPTQESWGVGGVIGELTVHDDSVANISNTSSNGDIYGDSYAYGVGGLIGASYADFWDSGDIGGEINISSSHSDSDVVGAGETGGLIGYMEAYNTGTTSITTSYATGSLHAYGSDSAGGLIGEIFGNDFLVDIYQSYATGNVHGTESNVGGLVGYSDNFIAINDAYATGSVEAGWHNAGGLLGSGYGDFTNVYATGPVSSAFGDSVGGLIGYYSGGTLDSSFATGWVSAPGATNIGGLIGFSNGSESSALYNNYFAPDTTGQAYCIGSGDFGECTAQEIGDPNYYFSPDNAPINSWNFDSVWVGHLDTYPTFMFNDTSNTPIIRNCGQLQSIRDNLEGTYILANDIDCSDTVNWNEGYGFEPIDGFSGSLDGDGYSINNIYIDRYDTEEDETGIFGELEDGANIQSLDITDGYISGYDNIGALAGRIDDESTVTINNVNTYNTEVVGRYDVGGLVGDVRNGDGSILSITNSSTDGEIHPLYDDYSGRVGGLIGSLQTWYEGTLIFVGNSSSANVDDIIGDGYSYGGLVGEFEVYDNAQVTLENLSTTGNVSAGGNVGGLFGQFDAGQETGVSSTIDLINASATGEVTGNYEVGGLIGELEIYDGIRFNLRSSFATGDVTAYQYNDGYFGGLIGYLESDATGISIRQSYATGDIYAPDSYSVGGLIGYMDSMAVVVDSYATGDVTGYGEVGGLIGVGAGLVKNTYASGSVTGGEYGEEVGGLIGQFDEGTVADSFSAGVVSGSDEETTVAGLIGHYYNYEGNSTTLLGNSYDREVSTQVNCSIEDNDDEYTENNDENECLAINGENSQPQYYLGNYINSPFPNWNVDTTWSINEDQLPTLQAYSGYGTPTSVRNLVASGNKENLHLTWDPPEDDGGSPVIGYMIEYRQTAGDEWDWESLNLISKTAYDNDEMYAVDESQIDYYSSYDFRVTAITEEDISAPSEVVSHNVSLDYEISSCEDLQNIDNDMSGNYTLTQDIDCSDTLNWNDGQGFSPLGINPSRWFTGTFNGDGHKITELYINRENCECDQTAGLFRQTEAATLSNFSLVGGEIKTRYSPAGAVAGYAEDTNVHNVSSNLPVSSIEGGYVGGLFGQYYGYNFDEDGEPIYELSNSFATGEVSSQYIIGGLAGYMYGARIVNSYYNGDVEATDNYIGGLVGYGDTIRVINSYAAGTVFSGTYYAGGLVGNLVGNNVIAHAFAASAVESGDSDYAGGLVGYIGWGDLSIIGSSYDNGLVGMSNCVGDYGEYDGCTPINTMENQDAGYYFSNSSNAPLGEWNFEDVWTTNDDNYPTLLGFSLTPSSPAVLGTTRETSSRVFLNWTSVSGADSYKVQYRNTDIEGDWQDYLFTNGDQSDTVVNGLTHNTNYQFRVAATNSNGDSSWSDIISASTTDQIYSISNCDELQDIQGDLDGEYSLANSINCEETVDWNGGAGFWPIANVDWQNPFTGSLDGNGWVIGGLTIDRTSDIDDSSALFFRTADRATIKDFSISGTVDSRYSAAGIIAFANDTFLENVNSSIDITTQEEGEVSTGGLVASWYSSDYANGHIINSSSSGEVNGLWYVGGIVGYAYKLVLSHSYSTSNLTGLANVGGIGGGINDSFVADVYSRGGVYADYEESYAGGLFGSANSTLIVRAYSSDQVFGDLYVGGLIGGSSNTQIQHSFSEAAVSGGDDDYTGGVIGYDHGGTVLIGVYFDQTRTEQANCTGNYSGTCEAYNTDGSDEYHYYGSTSLVPLDQWDFEGVWVVHDDDLPTLAGVPFLEGDGIRAQATTTSITVSWDGADSNGSPITGYELLYKPSSSSTWIPVTIDPALATSATVTGLTPSTQYDFSWRPFNAYGAGSRIQFYTWTKDADAPAPAKTTVVVTKSKSAAAKTAAPTESADIYLDDFLEYATGLVKLLDLKVGQVVHFTIERNGSTEQHTATVKEIGADYVILTIASTPFDVRLGVGELKTISLDGQAVMTIKLNSIDGGQANLAFTKLAANPDVEVGVASPLLAANTNFRDTLGVLCIVLSLYFLIAAIKPRKQHKSSK